MLHRTMRLLRSTLPVREGLSNSQVLNSSKLQLLLLLLHSGESHVLNLPVSLVELRGSSFFLSARKGSVHIQSSSHTIYPFLEQATHRSPAGFPRFIHFSNDGVQLARQNEDCLALYNTYKPDDVQVLQHFVHSNVKTVRKYRVHWTRSAPVQLSLIVNYKTTACPTTRSRHPRQLYLHNLSQYRFAGHLLRSSFSPYLLHAPRLKSAAASPSPVKCSLSNLPPQSFATNDYTVRQSEDHSETSVPSSFPEIEAMTKELVLVLDKCSQGLSSHGTIDFIRDSQGKMQLIGCRFEGVQNLSLLVSLSKRFGRSRIRTKSTMETNFDNYLEDFKLFSRIDKLRQQQAALKAAISEKNQGQNLPSQVFRHNRFWSNPPVQSSEPLNNSKLNRIADDFDKLRLQAALLKQGDQV